MDYNRKLINAALEETKRRVSERETDGVSKNYIVVKSNTTIKIERFSKELQKRNPDITLMHLFNDVYDESQANERYIAELELTSLGHEVRAVKTINILAKTRQLRAGAKRTLKQLKGVRSANA